MAQKKLVDYIMEGGLKNRRFVDRGQIYSVTEFSITTINGPFSNPSIRKKYEGKKGLFWGSLHAHMHDLEANVEETKP